jgi:hypothetical protein
MVEKPETSPWWPVLRIVGQILAHYNRELVKNAPWAFGFGEFLV